MHTDLGCWSKNGSTKHSDPLRKTMVRFTISPLKFKADIQKHTKELKEPDLLKSYSEQCGISFINAIKKLNR